MWLFSSRPMFGNGIVYPGGDYKDFDTCHSWLQPTFKSRFKVII
jgi:hypothetical protein